MQVNAINQFNSLNFEGKKNKVTQKDTLPKTPEVSKNKSGFMSKLTGPAAAAMFLIPVATTSLPSCEDTIYVNASASATVNYTPNNDTDTIRDTITNNDTVITHDTIYIPDTIYIRDSIHVPQEFSYPKEIEDSLNIWRGDFLDVPVKGDDGNLENKVLLYIKGKRDWENDREELMKINLENCRRYEAVYDHVIADSIKNDIRVTLVKPGDITVVKKDGTVTDQVSGLLFNEDGYKTFAHSNGKDKIFIYPKAMEGEHIGKFVELGTMEPGYLPEDGGTPDSQYGKNVLLYNILGELMEDHFINIEGEVIDIYDLRQIAKEQNNNEN